MWKVGDVVLVILPTTKIIGRCCKLEQEKVCLKLPFELIINSDSSISLVPFGILFRHQDPYLCIDEYKYIAAGVARDTLTAIYSQQEAELQPLLPPAENITELSKELIGSTKVQQFEKSQKISNQDPKSPTQCKIIKFSSAFSKQEK